MDLNGIRKAVLRKPFQPFSIRVADGRALNVEHPEFVAVGNRRVIVIEPEGKDDDSWSVLDPLLITSIDYGPDSAPPSPEDADRDRE